MLINSSSVVSFVALISRVFLRLIAVESLGLGIISSRRDHDLDTVRHHGSAPQKHKPASITGQVQSHGAASDTTRTTMLHGASHMQSHFWKLEWRERGGVNSVLGNQPINHYHLVWPFIIRFLVRRAVASYVRCSGGGAVWRKGQTTRAFYRLRSALWCPIYKAKSGWQTATHFQMKSWVQLPTFTATRW